MTVPPKGLVAPSWAAVDGQALYLDEQMVFGFWFGLAFYSVVMLWFF